jgi:dolichol-phosphate mannosyltransferase
VVIAAYDEVENIRELTERLLRALSSMDHMESELIFVVEGQDGTLEALQTFIEGPIALTVLYNKAPTGIGTAFRRGFDAVGPEQDLVVTMDADLNHSPEEIPDLLDALERNDADIVVGSRFVAGGASHGTPFWKRFLSGTINRLMRIAFALPVRDKTSGFRIYRSSALRGLAFENRDFAFLPEILILAEGRGFKIVEHPIQFRFRERGQSKMGFARTSLSYLRLFWGRVSHRPR